jgi:hypothetical protein
MAEQIAGELLVLVKVGAPHVRTSWGWLSVCNLLKMTSIKPEALPSALEALGWLVAEGLGPLNYVHALEAGVWLVERAAETSPALKVRRAGRERFGGCLC